MYSLFREIAVCVKTIDNSAISDIVRGNEIKLVLNCEQ